MKSRDYEEFIEFLNQLEARYLVVAAHAVAFHARPRATKDLDIFVEPTARTQNVSSLPSVSFLVPI